MTVSYRLQFNFFSAIESEHGHVKECHVFALQHLLFGG